MLVLTDAATEAVRSFTSGPEAPEGTGLRILAAEPAPQDATGLQVTIAARPGEGDEVIDAEGARVFVEPQAAAYLDDKVLDAQMDNEGNARFSLSMQHPQ